MLSALFFPLVTVQHYPTTWPATSALTTSLTAESLMFAAFTASYNVASSSRDGGRSKFVAGGWFGWWIVAVLALMATSAAAAWYSVFTDKKPSNAIDIARIYAVLVAAVCQPCFAAVINYEARR